MLSGTKFWISFFRLASVSAIYMGILTACSTMPTVDMMPTLSDTTRPTTDMGTLVVRVVNAGGNPVPINFLTIIPKNFNESQQVKAVRLEAFSKVAGKSTVFASPVPPGQYSFDSLRAFYSRGERWYSRGIKADVKFGTFNVKAGKVTDLGTVIYYPKPQGDVYVDTLARAPASHSQQIVSGYLPYLQYDPTEALGWSEDDMEDEHRTRYVSMVQNPVAYNERYRAPDGTVYLIGKLGAILKHTRNAEWLMDAVDTDADLLAIAATSAGDIVLGGEFGKLFLKRSDSNKWNDISFGPTYTVHAITIHDDKFIDVVLNDSRKVEIRRAKLTADNLNWQMMASFTPEGHWRDSEGNLFFEPGKQKRLLTRRISGVTIQHAAGQSYIFIAAQVGLEHSILDPYVNSLFRYDPEKWVVEKVREIEGGVDDIADAGAVTLGIESPGPFASRKTYYRFNPETENWEKVDSRLDFCPTLKGSLARHCVKNGKRIKRYKDFTFVSIPVFTSDMDAIAFVRFGDETSANGEAIYRSVVTTDGGETWAGSEAAPPNNYCLTTIPEIEGSLVVACSGVSSDFYRSTDQGVSWEHARQQENF